MINIVPEVLYVDLIQAKHPIIDWEIYTDEFGSAWKIIRVGGETDSYTQFEDLIRSCDREDFDTLWKLVQAKFKTAEPTDVIEKELWVHVRRLYELYPSDRHWRFEAHNLNTLWKPYDS